MRTSPVLLLVASAALSVEPTFGALVRLIGITPRIETFGFQSVIILANVAVDGTCRFLLVLAGILQAAGIDPGAVEAVVKALLAR
jgi:hypothetical protein